MRIAVTGASGFIGRHVVRALRRRGASVIAISRHPDAPLDGEVTSCSLDITCAGSDSFKRIGSPDALLHLAWGGLPNYHSSSHLEQELPVHCDFLESCVRTGLRKLVVTGTCLEYGMQSGELSELTECVPVTAYAKAKCCLHRHLLSLLEQHEFSLGWLRLFYLFGPGQASTSFYSQLRAAIESGATSFDMSAGDQVRDFLEVEVAAEYMAALTLSTIDLEVVNICGGKPATLLETARSWLSGWESDLILNLGVLPYPDYEPFEFWGSTRKLHRLAGAS